MQTYSFVKLAAAAASTVILIQGCGQKTKDLSDVQFDAAHSIALDGVIEAGSLIATSDNESVIRGEIKEQLMYTIGQFNGVNGVADARRTELSIVSITPRADQRFDVKYTAKLFIAWPREMAFPETYDLILPAAGNWQDLAAFYTAYGSDEHGAKKCLAWEAHEVSQGIFWYYYRPLKSSCPLVSVTDDEPNLVTRFPVHLALSNDNTDGKSPEYSKVWEDHTLYVTSIFGKYEAGATSPGDAGVAAYRAFYSDLIARFGTPLTTNLTDDSEPGVEHDDVRLTFQTPAGTLNVHLYLVDAITSVGPAFKQKYNERTQVSDFVSYSGHSGLGANIRALARMGEFVTGQYQIFMINGCDTFAYVDGALRDAHHVANPDFGPHKFFDIITNAMPSYFHMNSTANMAVITALVGQTQTYRQILADFDPDQRANVTGEEDNRWPDVFID